MQLVPGVTFFHAQTDGPARLLSNAKTRFSKTRGDEKISEISLGDKREMERKRL
jgi:hypothetical protein